VTITTAWCSSRSSSEVAVVCSGRNRPQSLNAQCEAMPRAAFVGGGDEAEQQLGAGGVQRGEADLVDQNDVVAQQLIDAAADAVVGDAAVEGLDQLGGGQVAHAVAGFDRGVAGGDEQVGLAGAGGADQAQVLGCADPLESREVAHGGLGHRGRGDVEAVEGLDDGEAGLAVAAAPVGLVAGGDLGFDEGAQDLFGFPALGLGGLQDVRRDAAHRGELEPLEASFEVGGQRDGCGGHLVTCPAPSRSRA